jgi:hypothetical protein
MELSPNAGDLVQDYVGLLPNESTLAINSTWFKTRTSEGSATRKRERWLTISIASGLVALIGIGVRSGQADGPKPLTAADVIKLWTPMTDGVEDFQSFEASPKESPGLAAGTFRVVGPSFERLWNHYAERCGIRARYEAKRLLVSGGTSAKGAYPASDRAFWDASVTRTLSVFLLRTDRYTVSVTIQPDRDGKSMLGSISAVIR